jgi:hypothetical protein
LSSTRSDSWRGPLGQRARTLESVFRTERWERDDRLPRQVCARSGDPQNPPNRVTCTPIVRRLASVFSPRQLR